MDLRKGIYRFRVHHILVWLLIGSIWFYLRYQDYSTINKALVVTSIKTVDLALMIYIANYLLIPHLLYKRRYLLFALAFIVMVLTSSIYKMYIIGRVLNNPALLSLSGNVKGRIYDNVIPHFFLVTAGVAIKLLFDYIQVQKRLAELALEKAEAELNFLKSQMNPHFLFNSLNAVYFLIDKSNTEARRALHKFSDMLRFQLYEVNDEKIPIEKEIQYLKDYIDLQRLRRDENCDIQFNISQDVKDFFIQPLLLIPFVENSFKHLSHYNNGKPDRVAIKLYKDGNEMKFEILNTTEERNGNGGNRHGGIGLNNVRRRLELLYPQKHQLSISRQDNWFEVQLTIKPDY